MEVKLSNFEVKDYPSGIKVGDIAEDLGLRTMAVLVDGQVILSRLLEEGIRAELDDRNEKIGHKIREVELQKVPYMLILGKREVQGKTNCGMAEEEGRSGLFWSGLLLSEVERGDKAEGDVVK